MVNRKVVAAVLVAVAMSMTFTQEASARHRCGGYGGGYYSRGYYGGGGCGGGGLGLAIGGLVASSLSNPYYGGGYGGGYDPYYAAPVAYQPYAAPYGYAQYPSYGYAPARYGYAPAGYGGYGYPSYSRRRHSNVLPLLIGAGIAYSILRHR